MIEPVGDHQAQNPIAEKLQPFVRRAGVVAGVSQRALEQILVAEDVAEPLLESGEIVPSR